MAAEDYMEGVWQWELLNGIFICTLGSIHPANELPAWHTRRKLALWEVEVEVGVIAEEEVESSGGCDRWAGLKITSL